MIGLYSDWDGHISPHYEDVLIKRIKEFEEALEKILEIDFLPMEAVEIIEGLKAKNK